MKHVCQTEDLREQGVHYVLSHFFLNAESQQPHGTCEVTSLSSPLVPFMQPWAATPSECLEEG